MYVKVFPNRFELKHIESGKTVSSISPSAFTTNRLLVGQFIEADNALQKGMKELLGKRLFKQKVVIHPMEMTEGGLSSMEERVLQELSAGTGSIKTVIWLGHDLTDQEVLNQIEMHYNVSQRAE